MNHNEKAFLNELKEEIAAHKKTVAIAGFFLFVAFAAIPVSVLIGSKLLATGAVCWIASFSLTCSAIDATKKMEEAFDRLEAVKLTVAPKKQQNASLHPGLFFVIGMN